MSNNTIEQAEELIKTALLTGRPIEIRAGYNGRYISSGISIDNEEIYSGRIVSQYGRNCTLWGDTTIDDEAMNLCVIVQGCIEVLLFKGLYFYPLITVYSGYYRLDILGIDWMKKRLEDRDLGKMKKI